MLGYDAMVSSGHNYSFVWNGDDSRVLSDYYTSKGKGTFNINPKNGFEGLFIGEESFGSILGSLSTSVESMIPTMNSQLSNDE